MPGGWLQIVRGELLEGTRGPEFEDNLNEPPYRSGDVCHQSLDKQRYTEGYSVAHMSETCSH